MKNIPADLTGHPPMNNIIVIASFAMFATLVLIWVISLLYNGYKTAANTKGTKAIVIFAIALIIADISSRYLIFHLN